MSAISNARTAEKLLRMRFEQEKRLEWERLSANVRANVERAVKEAHESGMSVIAIAREYGTSNRGTIYEILRRQDTMTEVVQQAESAEFDHAVSTISVVPDPVLTERGFPNAYRLSVTEFDGFTSTKALDAAAGNKVMSSLTFWVSANGVWRLGEMDDPYGPLHLEFIAQNPDSPITHAIEAVLAKEETENE